MARWTFGMLALLFGFTAAGADLKTGYSTEVPVTSATRMDWTFTVTNRSLTEPPASLLDPKFESAKQSFDLYLPVRKDAKQAIPAIVFINPGNDAGGWKSLEPVCTKLGMAFIAPRNAGNNVPVPKRCRIILDCLDEVRRQVPLDPDRTYIAGFSGGGRIACGIALALPEHFGGILPFCAGGELRDEPWLRHRAVDRLSVAMVTGTTDFNRGEVEKWKGPLWKELGIRTKVWVQNGLGHAVPNSATITEAIAWLEEDKTRRAALAKKHPASRANSTGEADAKSFADSLFAEGKTKLVDSKSLYAGLMLVKGVSERWPDSAVGKEAKKLLLEYDAKAEHPWEKDDIAEQRQFVVAEAKALSDYALNGLPAGSPYLKQRPDIAKRAISLWKLILDDMPESELAKRAKKLLPELEELLTK